MTWEVEEAVELGVLEIGKGLEKGELDTEFRGETMFAVRMFAGVIVVFAVCE